MSTVLETSLQSEAISGLPDWAQALKNAGLEQFASHGLPHRRLEAWKYTPLNGLEQLLAATPGAGAAALNPEPLALEGARELHFSEAGFTEFAGKLPAGVEVVSLAEALANDDGALKAQLEALPQEDAARAMVALNNAALGHGAVIRIAPGIDAGCIHACWRSTDSGKTPLVNSRLVVLLGAGAQLDWVEDVSLANSLNLVTQIVLDSGASCRHARMQENQHSSWMISRIEVEQGEDSYFEQASLDLGEGLARHDLRIALAGTGARCKLLGAYLPDGEAHVDHQLNVRHEAPGCHSEQTYRGVLQGQSRAVFSGRVHVLPGADDSEAHQNNANLLLSRNAEVDTKPELIIEADEVVASHGATVGQLDDMAVFYLQSRGISPQKARRMLTGAFCRSVVDELGNDKVRAAFSDRLEIALERQS